MKGETGLYQLFCYAGGDDPQPSARKRAPAGASGWHLVGTHQEFRAMMLCIKMLGEGAEPHRGRGAY